MPGLVPGIFLGAIAVAEMDALNKSGHDGTGTPGRAGARGESRMGGVES